MRVVFSLFLMKQERTQKKPANRLAGFFSFGLSDVAQKKPRFCHQPPFLGFGGSPPS